MRFGAARRADPILDVTPMIDIVFQLVLFFMVSTQFVSSPGIQVDLPRSSAQTVLTDEAHVNIWMTTSGAVYVDDVVVDTPELQRILKAKGKADPRTTVVLKADQGVPHGRVVGIMDMAHNYGLSNLAIATDPGADDGE
ncbi:MAG: biopolymer transporter ExbD [Rhodobacterales bacterium]|nr:biopolymer transporter ExbD [Rhodobacterales bacterium]